MRAEQCNWPMFVMGSGVIRTCSVPPAHPREYSRDTPSFRARKDGEASPLHTEPRCPDS